MGGMKVLETTFLVERLCTLMWRSCRLVIVHLQRRIYLKSWTQMETENSQKKKCLRISKSKGRIRCRMDCGKKKTKTRTALLPGKNSEVQKATKHKARSYSE